jgi:ABC-type branched-subunit amino acid transport system permease subunit
MKHLHGQEWLGLTCLIGFVVLPAFVADWRLSELAIFFTYGLFAVSLSFVWGHCGMLSLGQAVFFGVGAYAMSLATLGKLPGMSALASTWVGLIFAVITAGGLAWALGRFLFSARKLQGAFFGIIMLAVAFVVERLAINSSYLGGLNGLMNVPPVNLGLNGGGLEVWQSLPVYYISLTVLVAVIIAMLFLIRSPFGLALRAISGNEPRARALGYDTVTHKVRAFAIGGAIAGLAGALFVTQFNFASPALIGFNLSAEVLIWVAVGGRGYLVAAALGAIIVRWAESSFSSVLADYWLIVLGAMFIGTVMVLPRGLIGELIAWIDRKFVRR